MSLYIFNLIFLLLVYLFVNRLKISKKWFVRISLCYLFVISCLRDNNIGTDTHSYIAAFKAISDTGTYYMEKGFVLLNRIVARFTSNYIGVSIAVNLMLFIPLYKYITECIDEEAWEIAIAVFALNPYMFIESTFNILRQSCATGVILLGMCFLHKGKNIRNILIYLIMAIVAAQFHRIAFVMLIIPFVMYFPWNKIWWLFAMCLSVIMNVANTKTIQEYILKVLHFRTTYSSYDASPLNNPVYIAGIMILFLYLLSRYYDYTGAGETEKNKIDLYLFSLCFLIIAISNDMIYRVYVFLAYIALPGISVIISPVSEPSARVYLKNEKEIVRILYYSYYICFYFGYLVLLAIHQDVNYIPFKFMI